MTGMSCRPAGPWPAPRAAAQGDQGSRRPRGGGGRPWDAKIRLMEVWVRLGASTGTSFTDARRTWDHARVARTESAWLRTDHTVQQTAADPVDGHRCTLSSSACPHLRGPGLVGVSTRTAGCGPSGAGDRPVRDHPRARVVSRFVLLVNTRPCGLQVFPPSSFPVTPTLPQAPSCGTAHLCVNSAYAPQP